MLKMKFKDHIQGSSTMALWVCPECGNECSADFVPECDKCNSEVRAKSAVQPVVSQPDAEGKGRPQNAENMEICQCERPHIIYSVCDCGKAII